MDDLVQVTCEHWKISRQALFLWQSFANGLSPQCSCARSLPCNRQQRNLLTSNTHHEKSVLSDIKYYLPNNDKVKVSKFGKSENRNLWRQEMPVISPCGQPSHCPMRAFRCLRVRIHACLFCRDGREPVFAGLIGLLFDRRGK